jgi:diguanylate cyclase (GGDEF)-like protein/PAS domain S-box-containing protein
VKKPRARPPTIASRVVEQWPDAVMIANRAGIIEYVNPAFEALTGFSRAEVLGRTPAILKSGAQDGAFYRRLWREIRAGRPFRGVFVNRRKSGELFHEEEVIRPVRGPHGQIACFVSAGRDVSARVRELERLQHDASHDPLTGLPNRNLFADRLAQALRLAARRKEGLAVAILDLDGFRRANNRFGHLAGDAVLRSVARRTRRCVREADTVARIGGDEFALILTGAAKRAAVAQVLEKVRAANARPVRYAGRPIPVSLSIGAALYPRDARSEKTLHKRADEAMYAAKRAGGNRCRFARER